MYKDYASTVNCTFGRQPARCENRINKWSQLTTFIGRKMEKEGRYEQEVKELDEFLSQLVIRVDPIFTSSSGWQISSKITASMVIG